MTKRVRAEGTSLLADVAGDRPSLVRAVELGRRAGHVGFDWNTAREVREKVAEELAELDDAAADAEGHRPAARAAVFEELGDLLFAIANWGRHLGADPEAALAAANEKFKRRFGWMENAARERDIVLGTLSLAAWEQLWRESKAAVG